MVNTVLQKQVLQYCRLRFFNLKHISFVIRIFFFCNTAILFSGFCVAKDFATRGVIYPIEEQDPIALIQQKLKTMEGSGELKRRNLELQKHTRALVERPQPIEGITKCSKVRIFTFDPTHEVKEDLYDHQGQIFARKGTKINPLGTVSLSQDLLFFDGDDNEQVAWVQEKFAKSLESNSVRLILVKGAPLKLAEELNIPVYFDQNGILIKKLGISHVPTVVSQENLRLRIEEIQLPPSRESKVEGEQ